MSQKERKKMDPWERISEEDGAVTIMAIAFVFIGMILLMFLIDMMWLCHNRYQVQLMCDAATRAGTLAVEKFYAVRERRGYGLGDYHVYTELDPDEADRNAAKIIEAYKPDFSKIKIGDYYINEKGTDSTVWNNKTFSYEVKPLSKEKQYLNGVVNIRLEATHTFLIPDVSGHQKVQTENRAQSVANGSLRK